MKYSNYVEIHQCVMAYVLIVEQVAVLCTTGQVMTSKFGTIASEFYQTQWYKFPQNIQKSSVLLVKQSQQSFIYRGNSMTVCLLPTLVNVSSVREVEKMICRNSILFQNIQFAASTYIMLRSLDA